MKKSCKKLRYKVVYDLKPYPETVLSETQLSNDLLYIFSVLGSICTKKLNKIKLKIGKKDRKTRGSQDKTKQNDGPTVPNESYCFGLIYL